jgi:hypothetical protein
MAATSTETNNTRRHMKKTAKPKAKKQQPKQWWDGKGWDGEDRDPLAYVRHFCPSLVEKRASLVPFEDVICGGSAGPQPQAKDYDPNEEPYFTVEVNDPKDNSCSYFFKVTEHGVTYSFGRWPGDGTLEIWDADMPYSMRALWEFMRQAPRPAHVFIK